MYISTEISSLRSYGSDKDVIRLLKESGFTAYDFSMFGKETEREDYSEQAKELRSYADEIGIVCNQSHAPFPSARKGDEEYNRAMFPKLVRAVEISGILGAKVCVVHPCNDWTAEENVKNLYLKLAPYARKAGVKIGVENMWNWFRRGQTGEHVLPAACSLCEDFKAHMEMLPKDAFTACVDIGHAEMMRAYGTSAENLIETLGEYTGAMHLHDVDLTYDNHALPFTQKIDYERVIAALRKIEYRGDVTLESNTFFNRLPEELLPAAVRYAAEVANYMKERIEKK